MSFTESKIHNHEEQKKLKTVHDWCEKSKHRIKYEQYKKDVIKETRKRPFFMPKEYIPTTYYKLVGSEDEITKEFDNLHISKKKRKVTFSQTPTTVALRSGGSASRHCLYVPAC